MQHSPDRDGAGVILGEVFADPAFAVPKARDAAFAIVRPEGGAVIWANAAAAAHWGVSDAAGLALALFGPDGRGGWLDGLARGVVPGRRPCLARAGLARGFGMRAHTALVRAWAAADGAVLLGFAVPESAPRHDGAPDAWLAPAWPAPALAEIAAGEALAGDEAPAADAGRSLARRSQAAVLRDRLNQAFDGAASPRVLWRTDAAGAVVQIDAGSLARLGVLPRLDRGTLPGAVAGFDPAGGERLRDALAGRATWSGIVLALPVAGGAATVPMALSASPIFGPERAFMGFRGFGTVDLGRLELAPERGGAGMPGERGPPSAVAPPIPRDEAPEDRPPLPLVSPPAVSPPAVPFAVVPPPAAAGVVVPPPAAAGVVVPPPAAAGVVVPPPAAAGAAMPPANVVQLRAFQAMAPGRFAVLPSPAAALPAEPPLALEDEPAPAQDGDGAEPAAPPPLADDLAFLALGEALRARIGAPPPEREPQPAVEAAATEAEAVEPAPSPAVEPASAPAGEAGTRLLDQLPMPLVVMVGAAPAFANAAAAARFGHATPEALLRAVEGPVAAEAARAGSLVLPDARGQALAVEGRSSAISWGGAAATLWVLAEPAPAAARRPAPRAEGSDSREPGSHDAEAGAGELLDRVDDAVALLDDSGRLRRLNRRGEGWFGRDGVLGQSFTQVLAPESRAAALSLLGEVRGQRDGLGAPPLNREVLAQTLAESPARPGEAMPMLLTLGRLGTAGFYATLRDVTALKRAETERARSENEHARDVDRLPGLLAKVSHDIRTPLGAILGFAEVMMDERFGPLGNPRYRDYLKDIHASGTQVVALVDDLLDLSRIEAGQLDLDVAAVDVNRIVAEAVAQMQPEAHRERIIMRTSLGGRIPAALADERSTRQIVRNLLSNAVKFNEPGGQVIVSTALSDSGMVLLRVRDTGVGMTDDEIAAALEPIGALSAPHAANGNGLGLPLTRALVGANGASMAIRSRPREGTLVEVAFAAAVAASAAADEARLPA